MYKNKVIGLCVGCLALGAVAGYGASQHLQGEGIIGIGTTSQHSNTRVPHQAASVSSGQNSASLDQNNNAQQPQIGAQFVQQPPQRSSQGVNHSPAGLQGQNQQRVSGVGQEPKDSVRGKLIAAEAQRLERALRSFQIKYSFPPQPPQVSNQAYQQVMQRQLNKIDNDKLIAAARELGVKDTLINHVQTVQRNQQRIEASQASPESQQRNANAQVFEAKQRVINQILQKYNTRFKAATSAG